MNEAALGVQSLPDDEYNVIDMTTVRGHDTAFSPATPESADSGNTDVRRDEYSYIRNLEGENTDAYAHMNYSKESLKSRDASHNAYSHIDFRAGESGVI